MSATLLYEDRAPFVLAGSQRDPLRLTADELHRATGWERKPQGLCRGETCVPEPPGTAWFAALRSLEAPDFSLPDLDGRVHRLSDYRGKKIFLFSWGSY
jgi:hypothetical protein